VPYIDEQERAKFDEAVEELYPILHTSTEGELNYFLSKIVWSLWEYNKSYRTACRLTGVLENVKQEFYRRKVAPYEDEKIEANGDVMIGWD